MTLLLALFGGTALLLYGIRLSGDSMQRAIGGRLRQLLTVMSRTRLSAVFSGALVTAILQSSAATTLMLIGFVSAGLMSFRQTLGVILGADIGTTLTVQLIAFRGTDYALLLVGVGFLISFVSRRTTPKDVGQAILGLGLMFLGLKLILDGVAPLRANPLALELLQVATDTPIAAVLVAAVFSALVTSSAATIGLALALASQGLIALPGAVAIVLGANIGTCATALAASIVVGNSAMPTPYCSDSCTCPSVASSWLASTMPRSLAAAAMTSRLPTEFASDIAIRRTTSALKSSSDILSLPL